MKQSITAAIILFCISANAQTADKLRASQSTPQPISPKNVLFVDTAVSSVGNQYRIYAANWDSAKVRFFQLVDITDSITAKGDRRYPLLSGSYPNASFIPTLSASKVFGLSQVALDGQYGSLSGTPNLGLYYLNSNPNGFISGITKGMIVASLGYVPADSSLVATYNAGYALTKNGNTFNVDSNALASQFMSNAVASDSINSMKNNINGKADKATNITINGVTQNLAGSRTWTLAIPAAQVNSDWTSNSGVSQILNKPTIPTNTNQLTNGSGYITQSGARAAISLTTTGTSGNATYDNTTGVLNIPNYTASSPAFNNTPARSLNTSYQISTTRNARVSYSVTHAVALTLVLASGSTTAFLEISPNNSTWIEINRAGYSKSLAVAVAAGDNTTNNLVGEVPAGYWVRIRTAGTGGGLTSSVPNVTYNSGQEVQY